MKRLSSFERSAVSKALHHNRSQPLEAGPKLKVAAQAPTYPPSNRADGGDLRGLCSLPEDVLLVLLGLLDARTLLTCKRVCRFLRTLIDTDTRLVYCIELAINGMIDGPPTAGLTTLERLQKLREYSRRSRRTEDLVRCAFGSSISYELWTDTARSLIVLYSPPSHAENTDARRWAISLPQNLENSILAVDVTQDLVVAGAPLLNVHSPQTSGMMLSLLLPESGGALPHLLRQKMPWHGGDTLEPYLQVRNWMTGCEMLGGTNRLRATEGRNNAIAIYRFATEDGQPIGYVTTLQLGVLGSYSTDLSALCSVLAGSRPTGHRPSTDDFLQGTRQD
ncbi:hypothetical protein BD310DRAFT_905674 [Dichomitus squalens]|uniref:F-box domain-containing protein n=1 Tax=Dichomitus squalens TaxID=114155 RepID=A0A4Q9PZ20_9APHY|nr:hypothetical protein BD310DRAFT_905674 [Dichomitus squalens]